MTSQGWKEVFTPQDMLLSTIAQNNMLSFKSRKKKRDNTTVRCEWQTFGKHNGVKITQTQ